MDDKSKKILKETIPKCFLVISAIIVLFAALSQANIILAVILTIGLIVHSGLFYYFSIGDKKVGKGKKGQQELYIAIGKRWSTFITSSSILCASLLVSLISLFNKDIEPPYSLEKLTIFWIFIAIIFLICAFIVRWYAGMIEREKMLYDIYKKKKN